MNEYIQNMQNAMDILFTCNVPIIQNTIMYDDLLDAYIKITGDMNITGMMNPAYIKKGIMGHDTFEQLISHSMNLYLEQQYIAMHSYKLDMSFEKLCYDHDIIFSQIDKKVIIITTDYIKSNSLQYILDFIDKLVLQCYQEQNLNYYAPRPELILANNPTAGRTFSHGGLEYTVNHSYTEPIPHFHGGFGSLNPLNTGT